MSETSGIGFIQERVKKVRKLQEDLEFIEILSQKEEFQGAIVGSRNGVTIEVPLSQKLFEQLLAEAKVGLKKELQCFLPACKNPEGK